MTKVGLVFSPKCQHGFESSIDEHWQISTLQVAQCTLDCDKRLIKNGMNQMPRVQLYY